MLNIRIVFKLSAILITIGFISLSVTGCAEKRKFMNPIVDDGADPFVTFKYGFYYFLHTEGSRITITKSRTIEGISNGEIKTVFTPPSSGDHARDIWAPELHLINGKWYIYYTATTADGDVYNHRMFVLESKTQDPMGDYIDRGQIYEKNDKWAIDGTVLQMDDGSIYLIWSGFEFSNWPQKLYIAPLDKKESWKLIKERALLTATTLPWEGGTVEGPAVLKRNGKLFIVYSADDAGSDRYKLGLLTFTGNDVLDSKSWQKSKKPIFQTDISSGVYAPGHCSFTKSPDGKEDWIIYHAAKFKGAGYSRNARTQKFTWNKDGTPNLGTPVSTKIEINVPSGEE